MSRIVVLDSGVLSEVIRPAGHNSGDLVRAWMLQVIEMGGSICIPEIADYEVRRELLRAGKAASVRRLDALLHELPDTYLPMTRPVMRRAAELWAEMRNRGQPTAAPAALDGDVILAAAYQVAVEPFLADPLAGVVATTNVGHLSLMVPAADWRDIEP